MVVTRAQLISRAARRKGSRVGTISSGDARTAVLGGLINTTLDDSAYQGDRLIMLDAANETDKERMINIWEDDSGTAHFDTRSDTTYTSETYIVEPREDYALSEYREALNVALRETRRTYRYVLAVPPNATRIPLGALDFLIGADDVGAVWACESPNLLHNEDMALWQNGDALAPDGWTLDGSNATIERVSTGIRSTYAATVTRVGTNVILYQSIPANVREYWLRSSSADLTDFEAGAWVTTSTASVARIGIYNGSSTTYSSYHTGSGYPEWLTASYTPTATITDVRIVLSVDTTNAAATFHAAALVHASDMPTALKDYGSSAYHESRINHVVRNVGGVPEVDLAYPAGRQLIVYVRREFPQMDADTDEVDDQYARGLEAGLLTKLLQVHKPNQDRTRLDRILEDESSTWTRLSENFIDLPVPDPPRQVSVVGA